MDNQAESGGRHQPGVFLSYAHKDRSFALRFARDLRAKGVHVWIDEVEMGVGDQLLEKIGGAISEMDYLAVVISRHSAQSEWVRQEVEIAMRAEVAGSRVKVLPLLLRGGELPDVLKGKKYADFTSELAYPPSLESVLARLGTTTVAPEASDRLSELTSSNSLLRTALVQLRGHGLDSATSEALPLAEVDDFDLSEFLSLVAREVNGQQLFDLALTLVPCIDQRGVGQDALDYCLQQLDDSHKRSIGMQMQFVTTAPAIIWCHSRLTAVIRSDPSYHSFLQRHTDLVLERCFDEMASYLLEPYRGSANYNIESFEIVLSRASAVGPFGRRWREWIDNGDFDRDGSGSAYALYQKLGAHWGDPKFAGIVDAVEAHVHVLLRSRSDERVRDGLNHLVAMADSRYRGAETVLRETVSRVYDLPPERWELLQVLTRALEAVVDYNNDRTDANREERVRKAFSEVYDADQIEITEYWD